MSRILPFPRPLPERGNPARRLVAAVILAIFAAAVVWTTIVTMGSYCITQDSYAPLPGISR